MRNVRLPSTGRKRTEEREAVICREQEDRGPLGSHLRARREMRNVRLPSAGKERSGEREAAICKQGEE